MCSGLYQRAGSRLRGGDPGLHCGRARGQARLPSMVTGRKPVTSPMSATSSAVISDALRREVTTDSPVNLAFSSNTSLLTLIAELEALLGRPLERRARTVAGRRCPRFPGRLLVAPGLFPSIRPTPLHEDCVRRWSGSASSKATPAFRRHFGARSMTRVDCRAVGTMIYIATVHWVDPKWITPQRKALSSQLRQPFRVFANLQGIEPALRRVFRLRDPGRREPSGEAERSRSRHQQGSRTRGPDHVSRRGRLSRRADSIPGWTNFSAGHPLAAVRRDENAGDIQPHPCFCVTTVGFWNEIGGDWRNGSWMTAEGETWPAMSVARCWPSSNARSISWRPILRSNAVNSAPGLLWALRGPRLPPRIRDSALRSRGRTRRMFRWPRTRSISIGRRGRTGSPFASSDRVTPSVVRLALDAVRLDKLNAYIRKETRRSDDIYEQICSDPDFFRQFERPVGLRAS